MANALLRNWVVTMLWKRAKQVLTCDRPFVIVVTGSVGKTTTRDAIFSVLKADNVPVRSAGGNLNTEFGVPMAILGFDSPPHRIGQWIGVLWRSLFIRSVGEAGYRLVLEFASDKDGDIAFLASHVPVDIAVFTRFTTAHARTQSEVATEKLALLNGLTKNAVVVTNADDPLQKLTNNGYKVCSYGTGTANVKYGVKSYTPSGIVMALTYNQRAISVNTTLVASHQLLSIAAAAAVASLLKISEKALITQIEEFVPPRGRMRIIEGRKKTTIIDDSYNSSPAAAELAVAALKEFAGERRTVAILGNMNELGGHTVSAHIALGQAVARAKIGFLVAVGQNATRIVRGAREGGMPDQHMITFKTPEKLMSRLDHLIQSKDVILVKASQNGMRFERIVKLLMADPKQASKLLVRQDY